MNLNPLLRLGLTLNICVLFPVVSKDLFLQSLPKKFLFLIKKLKPLTVIQIYSLAREQKTRNSMCETVFIQPLSFSLCVIIVCLSVVCVERF